MQEVTQCIFPPYLRCQQVLNQPFATTTLTPRIHRALTYGVVDVLCQLLSCLLGHGLCRLMIMLIKPTPDLTKLRLTTTATLRRLVTLLLLVLLFLLQQVKYLTSIHAVVRRIKQPTRRHLDEPFTGIQLNQREVIHIVTRLSRKLGVLLEQMLPDKQVHPHLVQHLMHPQEPQLRVIQPVTELAPIPLIQPICTCGGCALVHHAATVHE